MVVYTSTQGELTSDDDTLQNFNIVLMESKDNIRISWQKRLMAIYIDRYTNTFQECPVDVVERYACFGIFNGLGIIAASCQKSVCADVSIKIQSGLYCYDINVYGKKNNSLHICTTNLQICKTSDTFQV